MTITVAESMLPVGSPMEEPVRDCAEAARIVRTAAAVVREEWLKAKQELEDLKAGPYEVTPQSERFMAVSMLDGLYQSVVQLPEGDTWDSVLVKECRARRNYTVEVADWEPVAEGSVPSWGQLCARFLRETNHLPMWRIRELVCSACGLGYYYRGPQDGAWACTRDRECGFVAQEAALEREPGQRLKRSPGHLAVVYRYDPTTGKQWEM